MFVTYNSDFTDMARKAKILADFLGVPLLAAPESTSWCKPIAGKMRRRRPVFRGLGAFAAATPCGACPIGACRSRTGHGSTRPSPCQAQVRLLPRSVAVIHDLSLFVILGVMIIGMDVLIVALFLPALAAASAMGTHPGRRSRLLAARAHSVVFAATAEHHARRLAPPEAWDASPGHSGRPGGGAGAWSRIAAMRSLWTGS